MKKTRFFLILLLVLTLFISLPALAENKAEKLVILEESLLQMPQAEGLTLYVMPLLGADCMLLNSNGQWMLVDMGKRNDYPLIKEHMDRLGVSQIDITFNTHPHSDHIGSMPLVLEDYPVSRFITVYPENFTGESILQRSVIKHLKAANVPIERMEDGSEFTFGEARVQVYKTGHNNVNGSSAVLKFTLGDTSFLLAADITRQAQNRLNLTYGDALKADVLKYPHHAQEKLDQGFTETVSPLFSIITHGSKNTVAGQKWLNRYDVPFKFASWGIISIHTDGHTITVSQELSEDGMGYLDRWMPAD